MKHLEKIMKIKNSNFKYTKFLAATLPIVVTLDCLALFLTNYFAPGSNLSTMIPLSMGSPAEALVSSLLAGAVTSPLGALSGLGLDILNINESVDKKVSSAFEKVDSFFKSLDNTAKNAILVLWNRNIPLKNKINKIRNMDVSGDRKKETPSNS